MKRKRERERNMIRKSRRRWGKRKIRGFEKLEERKERTVRMREREEMADGVNKMRLKAKEREKVKFLKAFKQGRSGVNTDLCKRKEERESFP